MKQFNKGEIFHREFRMDGEINTDKRTVELSFSSEMPVERWFGIEILDHSPKSVILDRLNDGAPLLLMHNTDQQIGVVESARIDADKVARATVRFSKSDFATDIFMDVQDKIRQKVSVGYRIIDVVLESTVDGVDTYRVTKFEPFEISIVSVPADNAVGVNRADENIKIIKTTKERNSMSEEKDEKNKMDEKLIRAEAQQTERKRVADIGTVATQAVRLLGKQADELARTAIQSGKSLDEFREDLLGAMNKRAEDQRSPLGMSDKEVGSFSFMRLFNAMASNDWSNAGYEREICGATAKRTGLTPKGALIPTDVLSRAITTTAAASNISTDVLATSFIDVLRNKLAVRRMGATVLGGLQGNVSIPRQSGGATAQWVAEGVNPPPSQAAFDAVALSPKGVAAETQVTTQTLIQSSLDMEALLRMDLVTVLALAIDAACINGSGIGAEPTGLLNTAGVGSVALGANGLALPSIDPLIDMETAISALNADVENMAYLTNPHVIGVLKKLKTTTGEYLWTNEAAGDYPSGTLGSINGYAVARSNQVPNNLTKGTGVALSALIFGNWADLLIGEWGALDVQVDPYTAGIGNLKIKVLQFVDCGVRHPESFAAITDIV